MSARGFYDLNLAANRNSVDGDKLLIATAFKLGYDVVALNTIAEPKDGKVWGEENKVLIPNAPNLDELNRVFNSDKTLNFRPRKVLSRLTLPISDPSQIPNLMSSHANQYDILAVEPSTPKALQAACETMDIDIISFDFGGPHIRNFALFQTPLMKVAIRRGVTFEICYSALFHDRVTLQYALAAARRITHVCKSKNLIVSSFAKMPKYLRGPYDVANLGYLFGMVNNVKWPVSWNGRAVILKAECRKSAKGAIQIVSTVSSEQITSQPKSPEKTASKRKRGKKRKLE